MKRQIVTAVIAFVLLLSGICLFKSDVRAEGMLDIDQPGSITIVFPKIDTEFDLYRIGRVNEDASVSCVSPFDRLHLNLSDADAWETIAEQCASYVEKTHIPEDAHLRLQNHKGTADHLESGVYLVTGQQKETKQFIISPVPFLISIPQWDGDEYTNRVWIDLVKYTQKDKNLRFYEVIKKWEGDTEEIRPDSISVDLYHNHRRERTIELSKGSHWYYSWYAPVNDSDWTVRESEVPGYASELAISTEEEKTVFTITNRLLPEKETIPDTSDHLLVYAISACLSLCLGIGAALILFMKR